MHVGVRVRVPELFPHLHRKLEKEVEELSETFPKGSRRPMIGRQKGDTDYDCFRKGRDALESFRPRNRKEFVVLQIAQRFNDQGRLAKYLNAAEPHPKNVLLEAARLASKRASESGQPAALHFFALLEESERRPHEDTASRVACFAPGVGSGDGW
jgi:hypothetical protein